MHLLLPFFASVLFVCGLIFVKKAGESGSGPLTIMFVANACSAVFFSGFLLLGGTWPAWTLFWQPCVIAVLFMLGLTFTFLAIHQGDVSVATPIFGMKVVFVAVLLTFIGGEQLPTSVWYAALLATLGIGLIQWTGKGKPHHIVLTIVLALSAATCYATFDVLVQRWAPSWGAGRFLPTVFWMVGLLSLGMVPWVQWSRLAVPSVRRVLIPGAVLVSLQAICITGAVAIYGDAARVNVVYAMRGIWGVGLAWIAAKIWGGAEAEHGRQTMLTRGVGALLLTSAVVIVILWR